MSQQSPKASDELEPIEDTDMDSLFILPLSIIPLETPTLQRARMIKNQRLQGVVEFFSDINTGSGQVDVGALPKALGWDLENGIPNDLLILRKLAPMPSYDVYSLRILLRQAGISVNQSAQLRLSDEKNRELSAYMTRFTGPLITHIYGTEGVNINSFDDIIALFRDPDVKAAREKLRMMSEKLEIDMMEIPRFLEDYGDIFMSLSYYRHCLDRLAPHLDSFLAGMDILRKNWQVRNDYNLMKTCAEIETTLNDLSAAITGRFENFDRQTNEMWNHISAQRFRSVKDMIQSYHTALGGILCALTVKMNAWVRHFPKRNSGGPVRRGEVIMSEMRQGVEEMKRLLTQSERL